MEAAIGHVIELANEHGSALLWVWHSSRLARGSGRKGEARSILEVLTYLLRHRVTVRSVEDNEFTTNEMLWGFAAKQANKYAADLSVWVREGKERQWERGEWLGGPIPDGYLGVKVPRGDDPRKTRVELRLDPEREPVTCRLWALARDGHAPAPLARILNSAGLRTRAGRAGTRRRVQDTLENAVYAGPPRSGVAARLPRPTETCPRAILPLRPWIASQTQQNTVGNAARQSLARGDSPPVAAWCSA